MESSIVTAMPATILSIIILDVRTLAVFGMVSLRLWTTNCGVYAVKFSIFCQQYQDRDCPEEDNPCQIKPYEIRGKLLKGCLVLFLTLCGVGIRCSLVPIEHFARDGNSHTRVSHIGEIPCPAVKFCVEAFSSRTA